MDKLNNLNDTQKKVAIGAGVAVAAAALYYAFGRKGATVQEEPAEKTPAVQTPKVEEAQSLAPGIRLGNCGRYEVIKEERDKIVAAILKI